MKGIIGMVLLVMASSSLFAASQEIDITPYATANIQANLYSKFPTGTIIPSKNDFDEPFKIPPLGDNYVAIEKNANPLTLPIGVAGVRRVYTLMQAFAPVKGPIMCKVDFNGSEGAHETFRLIIGQDIRDFYQGAYAHTINEVNAQYAYEFTGQGGAYTNDSSTGMRGIYHFDEQEFVLDSSFAGQTLDNIKFTNMAQGGAPMLLALTVETSAERKIRIFSPAHLYYGGLVVALFVLIGVAFKLRMRS